MIIYQLIYRGIPCWQGKFSNLLPFLQTRTGTVRRTGTIVVGPNRTYCTVAKGV